MNKKTTAQVKRTVDSCYLCSRVEASMRHLMKSTVNMWSKDNDFRQLFNEQDYLCLPHCEMLITEAANIKMNSSDFKLFYSQTVGLLRNKINICRDDIDKFCKMFDYRSKINKSEVPENCIESCVDFLCGK